MDSSSAKECVEDEVNSSIRCAIASPIAPSIEIEGIGSIPLYPNSWYRFGSIEDVRLRPRSRAMLGCEIVAFQTRSGRICVMDARCVHMHADLGNGRVVDESIECPLHLWRFGVDGRCMQIPSSERIPAKAKQRTFPTQVRHGQIYFFFGDHSEFELPFYEGWNPDDFAFSGVHEFVIDAPWYMVAINSVDVQHFRGAHDRLMIGEPKIDRPTPQAYRSRYQFKIIGKSWSDQITKWYGGPIVQLEINEWKGNFVLAHSVLTRAQTFGMVILEPEGHQRTRAHIMVLVPKSRSPIGGRLIDRFRTGIRSVLINRFLSTDISRLRGTYVRSNSLIQQDKEVVEYLRFLCEKPHHAVSMSNRTR